MDILKVVLTVVLLVILVLAIVKKFNILATLLFLTFIGFFFATVITGTSTMAEGGTGSMWLDIFEQFKTSFASTLAGNGLLIMVVMAYAAYMGKIKASNMFAGLAAIPVAKVKQKFVLVAIAPLIGLVFQIIIPSGMSAFVVALSTIYPILVVVGVNPLTAALALLFGCNVFTGPANPFVAMCLQMMGMDIGVADFFFRYGLIVVVLTEIFIGIVMAFWSKHLDEKQGISEAGEVKQLDIKELGVPKFYAILPIVPLIFIIIFSSFCMKTTVISVVGAHIVALCIAVLVHVICTKKNKKEEFGAAGPIFFDGMGDAFAKVVSVVGLGTFFAAALTALGGVGIAINWLVGGLGLGFWPMLIIFLVLYFIMAILGGPTLSIPILAPAIAAVAATVGATSLLPCAAVILTLGGGLGLFLMPYDPKLLMCSQMHDVDISGVLKRTSVPCITGAIFTCIVSVLLFGGIF